MERGRKEKSSLMSMLFLILGFLVLAILAGIVASMDWGKRKKDEE